MTPKSVLCPIPMIIGIVLVLYVSGIRGYPFDLTNLEFDDTNGIYEKESKHYEEKFHQEYQISQKELNWDNSRRECKRMGMVLASPVTESEKDNLENYLREHSLVPEDQYSGYWIGGHRESLYGVWTWESNGREMYNMGWCPGEPSSFKGEDCLEIKNDIHNNFLGWNNYHCYLTRRFICETVPVSGESDKNLVTGSNHALHEEVYLKALTGEKNISTTTNVEDILTIEEVSNTTVGDNLTSVKSIEHDVYVWNDEFASTSTATPNKTNIDEIIEETLRDESNISNCRGNCHSATAAISVNYEG